MKKIILVLSLVFTTLFLAGCNGKPEIKTEETLNPLSPSSMANTYQDSKEKINDAVKKQNEITNRALEESGLNE